MYWDWLVAAIVVSLSNSCFIEALDSWSCEINSIFVFSSSSKPHSMLWARSLLDEGAEEISDRCSPWKEGSEILLSWEVVWCDDEADMILLIERR